MKIRNRADSVMLSNFRFRASIYAYHVLRSGIPGLDCHGKCSTRPLICFIVIDII